MAPSAPPRRAPRRDGSSVVPRVVALGGLCCGPFAENLVANVPQLGEEPLLHAMRKQIAVLAFERRRAGADDAIDEDEVAVAPGLQQLVVVDEALAEREDQMMVVRTLVDLAQGDPLALEEAGDRWPDQLAGQSQHGAKAGGLLARAATEAGADRHV